MRSCSRVTRRHFLGTSAAVAAASTLAVPGRAEVVEASLPWLAGAGGAEITPPLDVGILMSSGLQLWEPFEGVRLPLYARAVVVEKGGRRVAVVSLDVLGVASKAVGGMDEFKQRVAAACNHVVAADDLVLCSTHTHSGVESTALTDLYRTTQFKSWVGHLARQIGSAVRTAADSSRRCKLMAGSRVVPGLTVNRRIKTTTGIASVRQQLPPENVIGPEGPNDDSVQVAAFIDDSDRPVAVLVNATAHPVLEMCIKQVSPDYPGEMCLELERRHPGAVPLFLQGACGNINPPTMDRDPANARRYGRDLAAAVDETLDSLAGIQGDELVLRRRTVKLPARDADGQPAPEPLEIHIAVLRIGRAVFAFLPGEPFVEIGLAIRRASPWDFTAVVGYAEDYIGYIPTDRAFANGGYETRYGRWSRLAPGAEPAIRRAAVELVSGL